MRHHRNQELTLIGGIGLGAGLMYLLDPERGKRRRAWMRDKCRTLAVESQRGFSKTARDFGNRVSGLAAEVKSIGRQKEVPDEVLAERVRSKLGRLVSHPGAIDVGVFQGCVTLRGAVLANELDDLLSGVLAMKGVKDVENRLDCYEEPTDVPGLQGPARRPAGGRFELLQENWTPAARCLVGTSGGAVALYGLARGDAAGRAASVAGLALVARSLTNMPMKRLAGFGGRRGFDIQKTININAPVDQVFTFWSNFENFPRFMSHVHEVRNAGDGRTHWKVAGPAGLSVEWDARITRLEPHRLLAWKSASGALVRSAGVVRFEPNDGGTHLDIRLSYNPPAGALGHVVAKLFGSDPKRALDEDLVRFKSLIEQGKTTAHGETVRREEVA